jgi:hypothetical protein
VQKLGEILLYAIVLLAGLAGLAITTCGSIFLLNDESLSLAPFAILSVGVGVMVLVGVFKFLTRDRSTDT